MDRTLLRDRLHDDRGFTMIELVVAMSLMSVFMAIFTTIIYIMTGSASKVARTNNAVTQVNLAFLALDKSVRYASAIMPPARTAAGGWHLEYDSDLYVNGAQTDTCTQLRTAPSPVGVNQQLQMRKWTVSGTSYSGLTAWRTLATNVTNGSSATSPFATNSIASSAFQQLTLTLTAASDNQSTKDTNTATVTFSAVNSTAGTTQSVCQQVSVDATS